ncbi:uncharacterized mitochondrial protein-like protein [Tanacetum coccineum]
MDVKSDFLYGKIEEEVYVCQPPGFEDPNFPDRVYVDDIIFGSTKKKLCTEFEKMMHKKFQMSSMGELTFFLGLQVKQKEDGIFISQDKYVTEILKKFGFSDVKTANTPMETHKPLLKDADGEDVDEHMYRSMIGSLMYLTSSRPDIIYLKGQPKLGLWYPKDSPFDLVAYTDSGYVGASLDRKSTTGDSNEKKLIQMIKIHTDKNVADLLTKAFDKGIGVNAGDSKLKLLGINLLLLVTVNAARHNLLLLVIVDFLNTSLIKYALTVNPTIYTSCIEQFWSTAKAKTVNGEVQLQALVDGKKIIITESTIRRDLQLEDAKGVNCLPNATIFKQLTLMGKPKKKDTQIPQSSVPSDNIAEEAINEENIPTHSNDPLLSGEDRLKLKEMMTLCTNLQNRVLDLENTKTTQALEIDSLKGGSRSLRRNKGLGEDDASKQGRKIHDIDVDEDITLENVHDEDMFDTSVFSDEEVFARQDMAENKVSTADLVTTADEVVTAANVEVSTANPTAATITTVELTLAQTLAELKSARPKTKGVVMQEPSEGITTTTIPLKDKGKGIMVEEPLKMKKKDQISFDEQEAIRLQDEFDKEVRLAREKDEANVEDQEELTVEEKSKLFVQLLEARKKHFAAKRAEEKRNKPPTKSQQRSIMTTYLKNMEAQRFEEQKVDDDQETSKLQSMMKIVPDEEEVAVDAIPLATKPPSIMLKSFDRKDLETLWKLVKAKHRYTRPKWGYKRVLWGDLKTMFEHHVEDAVLHVFMLVEKRYPLTPATITKMLNKKLQADHCNEMFYQLLKLMTKKLKNQRSVWKHPPSD